MNNKNSSSKNIFIYLLLFLFSVAIALGCAFLLTAEGNQNEKFYVSLTAIIFAVFLTFMRPIGILLLAKKESKKFIPVHLGTMTLIIIYDIVVALLVPLAYTNISYKTLIVLHLISALLVLMIGAFVIGYDYIKKVDTEEKISSDFLNSIKDQIHDLCSRLNNIEDNKIAEVKKTCNEFFEEDLKYDRSPSTPKVEDIEKNIEITLEKVKNNVRDFVNNSNSESEIDIDKFNITMTSDLKEIKRLFKRRREISTTIDA